MNWISVDDGLPNPHVKVLAALRDIVSIAQLSASNTRKPDCWYVPEMKCWVTEVTHWMPLPPKP